MNSFGFAEASWDSAKSEARRRLIRCAKAGQDICYSDLVVHIRAITFEPHDVRLFHLLGEISVDEHSFGRPLLSVMVVHKNGDRQPGPGFFDMAQELGNDTSDRIAFWIQERNRTVNYWQENRL